jgi:hypothetical protein
MTWYCHDKPASRVHVCEKVHPDFITTQTSIEDILNDAGDAAANAYYYYYTPLDFVSRNEWSWSIIWSHGLTLLRKMHLAAPPAERPIPRKQNSLIPAIEGRWYAVFVVVSLGYFGIFLAGWNFSFPTRIESIMWRVATVTAVVSALAECVALQVSYTWYPALRDWLKEVQSRHEINAPRTSESEKKNNSNNKWKWFKEWKAYLENNSLRKDPIMHTPLGLIAVTWVCGIFYCLSRAYVVIADIIELRSLPSSAYQEVEWSGYWPHW